MAQSQPPTQGIQLLRAGSPLGQQALPRSWRRVGGGALKIFISSLATVLSLTQRIHSFKVEAAMTWKIVSSEKKLHIHSISSNVPVKLACWAVQVMGGEKHLKIIHVKNEKCEGEWQAFVRGLFNEDLRLFLMESFPLPRLHTLCHQEV